MNLPLTKVYAGLAVCLIGMAWTQADARVLVHSGGFEAYSTSVGGTGRLAGQVSASITGATWQQVGGSGTAVVQSAVVESGAKAIRVNRAANSDDRWSVTVPPQSADRFITIEWDMYVESSAQASGFGPFFGIEAYDSVGAPLRFGMLGVDAATSEVLYGDQAVGLTPVFGATAPLNAWNSFKIVVDLSTDLYFGYVNGAQVIATPFEFPAAAAFTDADIAALAAGGDAASLARPGTAYFDNYLVRSGIRGDYNSDGVVDAADFTVWRDQRGTTGLLQSADGDFNGVVDDADYAIWANQYGAAQSLSNTATSVPEPTTAVLIVLMTVCVPRRRAE